MKYLKTFFFTFIISFNSISQHLNYSQFYSSPLNLNPAMTGIGEFGRMGIIYRNQWPNIGDGLHYFSSWVDYNFLKTDFSFGLNFSNEIENLSNLSTSNISPSISYEINLNYNWILKSGIQVSYSNSNFNSNNLIFYDQLNQDGSLSLTNENIIIYDRRSYVGLAAGLLAYSDKVWIGASIFNLNNPNISFLDENFKLNKLYSIHFGYYIENLRLSPSIHYKQHSVFKQLDIGTYIDLKPINIGMWYRGIPIDSNNNFNSLIGSLSLKLNELNLAYSYDYNLSEINSASGGSHEISLIYNFHFFGKKLPPKNVRFLECPIPNF